MKKQPVMLCDLMLAVAGWEEAVDWIAKGFDCIEEYTNDLYARERLDNDLSNCEERIPDDLVVRIMTADERFKSVTYASNKCVWGDKDLYDPVTYWYYYRWQNE